MSNHTPSNLSSVGRRFFSMIEFDDKEKLIAEIRKHPFGLAVIYLTGVLIAVVVVLIASLVLFSQSLLGVVSEDASGMITTVLTLLMLILVIVVGLMTVVSAMLYKNNVLFLTDQKISQVIYTSIFNRKISQLNIGNVQDVTVTQDGIFSRMFDYGTLIIETAGEQQNYTFSYAPKPYLCAKQIVTAHEEYEKIYGN